MWLKFSSNLLKSTLKLLRLNSFKALFHIWLYGDSTKLKILSINLNCWRQKNPNKSKKYHDNTKLKKLWELSEANTNCNLLKKESICYINHTLQSFSSVVQLWTKFSSHSDTLSPLLSSFLRTMSRLKSGKAALNSLQFLCRLQNIIVKFEK